MAVARGGGHACVLLANRLKCWGANAHGQLGLGDMDDRGDQPAEMGNALPALDLGHGQTPIMLALGETHSCAVLDQGKVKCWGDNAHGQLGLGDTNDRGDEPGEMGDALPALDLGSGRSPIMLASGKTHTCAVFDDGGVKCWGDNADGQLGLGDTRARGVSPSEMGDNLPLVDLGKGRSAMGIAAGQTHTCALLDGGQIKCWGYNADGQLGLGDTQTRGDLPHQMGDDLSAIDLGAGQMALAVTAGGSHGCALLVGAATKCWGRNVDGQLGLGDTDNRGGGPGEMGDRLPPVDLAEGVLSVAAGLNHSCALLDGGAIKCWGLNVEGQLGLGDGRTRGAHADEMGDHLPTVDLGEHRDQTEPRSVIAIALGLAQSCGLLANGAVKCWGGGETGALGSGNADALGDGPNEMGDALAPIDLGD